MRLLKLGIYHPTYLRNFYSRDPELSGSSYANQLQTLIDDCFGSSDFWTNAISKLGYETAEVIANADFLQNRWAEENSLTVRSANGLFEISAAQIVKFRPDVLLVADYSTFTPEYLRDIRRNNPSIKLIMGWCGAPLGDSTVFREWDVALSCVPELVGQFRSLGVISHHVNHAFDSRVLSKLDLESEPDVDFAFVGSVVKKELFHIERERLLLHLLENTDLKVWSDAATLSTERRSGLHGRSGYIPTLAASAIRRLMRFFPSTTSIENSANRGIDPQGVAEEISRRSNPACFGREMFQRFRDSRVVFNNHIDASTRSASNMRLFEATGVGACLLTDWKENLSELFEPDVEVLTYRSVEECVEKLNYVLEHEEERRSIAYAGQARTLRRHNFDDRAAKIDEIVRGSID